ncbi:hypothetical protein [Candidatus Uabimicrobium sp. HlEnr_7]|uniref:hypothetical protein n=1 Tax=Candidatus Uabimicrobium helgolandensis TaxID=3095367 RepID=UPI00355643F8
MIRRTIDRLFTPIARQLEHEPKKPGKMSKLGINNTMRLAKWYNTRLYGKYLKHRRKQYQHNFMELLNENGKIKEPALKMNDGWVIDTSLSLPYLQDLLDEADKIIKERGRKIERNNSYRAFFRNIISVEDLSTYPSFLNFILSSQVLATACNYLGFIPCMPKDRPIGVRFAASSTSFDESAHLPPRDSQLFHIDPYCTREVYVIVLLHDIRADQGPFCFFPESLSQKAAKKLGYWTRRLPYRLSDELVYSILDKKDRQDFVYPKGSVLFIDPSKCFHYGSRNTQETRYQLMYALANPCRTDFSETVGPKDFDFPIKDSDSRLRKMVLDKNFMI